MISEVSIRIRKRARSSVSNQNIVLLLESEEQDITMIWGMLPSPLFIKNYFSGMGLGSPFNLLKTTDNGRKDK